MPEEELPAFGCEFPMQDTKLYQRLLGIQAPWQVDGVDIDVKNVREGTVTVSVSHDRAVPLPCPECGADCPGYDTRERRWRHLDTMQYRTILVAQVPRVRCPTHDVRQVDVPWAEQGSRFTALFEMLVIDWLQEASFAAVARRLNMTWDQVAGVQDRAVERGLARRDLTKPKAIGVDETSFKKGHDYVTVVNDLDAPGHVLHVADGRRQGALDEFFEVLGEDGAQGLEHVAMDMWPAYIKSTERNAPQADIVFDKFHIAKHLGDAVDKVRRSEHKALTAQGDHRLKKTKHLWLRNPENMSSSRWRDFAGLRKSELKVARAWAIKEMAMSLWGYRKRGWAERMWKRWYQWAIRCRLEPMKRVARMIKAHWEGVMNAVTSPITNARAEGINRKIQWIKRKACGFRNRERFRMAIYFHLGGLDLYPAKASGAHT